MTDSLFFLYFLFVFPSSNFFSALGLLIAWEILLCGVVTCLNKGGAFSFSYSPSSGVFFELLSWDYFLVGMMISRIGWIFVGALRLYFPPMGRKWCFFFPSERKSDM